MKSILFAAVLFLNHPLSLLSQHVYKDSSDYKIRISVGITGGACMAHFNTPLKHTTNTPFCYGLLLQKDYPMMDHLNGVLQFNLNKTENLSISIKKNQHNYRPNYLQTYAIGPIYDFNLNMGVKYDFPTFHNKNHQWWLSGLIGFGVSSAAFYTLREYDPAFYRIEQQVCTGGTHSHFLFMLGRTLYANTKFETEVFGMYQKINDSEQSFILYGFGNSYYTSVQLLSQFMQLGVYIKTK